MKLGIIDSAFQQAGVDTKSGLEHIARIGFDCVDIFTEALSISEEDICLIEETCLKNNLPVTSLPVVSAGLIDFNEPVREFHLQRCKKFIDLCARFNADNLLLVLGEYIWQREVIPPDAQWQWAVENTKLLGDYAAEQGIEIALELEPFRLSLLNNLKEMTRFLDDCDHPAVKANIDISHLVLADVSPSELTCLKGRAAHVHISDCDGKVHGDLPPGRGVVKFMPYLQAIKELEINGTIALELEYSPDPSKIVEWVEEAYFETDRMMRELNLRD